MEVRLLGPLEVTVSGRVVEVPGQRLRALLALLALDAGRVVSVDRLLDALYGEDLPQQAENALQQAVSKLRRRLGDAGVLVTRAPGYLLDVRPEDVDALRFEQLLAGAARLAADDDPAGASSAYDEALGLWRGEALTDLPLNDVVAPLRARLDERRLTAVEDRVEVELALGHHAEQVAELDALVADEPLRERRWGQLMLALYRSGRQADALRAFRRAQETLVEELGIEPGPELRALEGRILAQDESLATAPAATPAPVPRPRSNLRAALGPCLGREDELARLADLLVDHRLVTIVATGGAGKTRIALELGHRLADAGAVSWVDLVAVTDRAGVVGALRRTSGLAPGGDLDELVTALSTSSVVLVLDNCEQAVEAVAVVVDELLARGPTVQVVATSREGLGVPGEVLFPLSALDVDTAVQLFTSVAPAGATDHEVVRAICERLDGLPLAIELAAARARHLGPTDLLDRLDQRFEVLAAGPRTAQARQRSLRALVDWSYDLLDADEQRAFARLAVFRDGVPLAAAAQAGSDDDLPAADVEDILLRLVDKSLVTADTTGPATRLRLLQTLRDYGAERLDEAGARDDAERRRAAWLLGLANEASLLGSGSWRERDALQGEQANVDDAVGWALANDTALAVDLCAELGWHWYVSLQAPSGWAAIRTALAADGVATADPGQVARAQSFGALLGAVCGDVDDARTLAASAMAFERARGEPRRLAAALLVEGTWRGLRGDTEGALALLAEASDLDEIADDDRLAALTEFHTGFVQVMAGRIDEARARIERSATFLDDADLLGRMAVHVRLADLAMRQDRHDEAGPHLEQALALDPDARHPALHVEATARLARVCLAAGDGDRAIELAADALRRTQDGFLLGVSGQALQAAGAVNVRLGDPAEGLAQLEAAVARYRAAGAAPSVAMAERDLDEARALLATRGQPAEST
jgi:predicted ATPase/DNA-binding SARP family transcriptional activator